MKLDEAVIVDVDLTIAPQCEHTQHGDPDMGHAGDAKYLILARGHGLCSSDDRFLICAAGWERAQREGYVTCGDCGEEWWVGSAWQIIHTL